uniref:Uncharacterized protein n=1 Tax=Mycena chlorophos TaxID=658473 RepID=A0ABQ0KZH4_MYCCL|nr:predicted protein [Mycena chlorophos]
MDDNPAPSSSSRPSDSARPNKRPRPASMEADPGPAHVQAGPVPAAPIPAPILFGSMLVLQSIFLGRCLSHSFVMDPRHLETYIYGFWAMALFGYASSRQTNLIRLIQSQFPIWSSQRDLATRNLLNNGGISAATQPDGTARGVFVDLAVIIPITEPRKKLKKRTRGLWPTAGLAGKSLDWFYANVVARFPALEPAFLRVIGLLAPLLIELKRGPPRHASSLSGFYLRLCQLLEAAKEQVEKQAMALYGSWRYRSQDHVFVIAASGDYFVVGRVQRSWANFRDVPDDGDVDGDVGDDVASDQSDGIVPVGPLDGSSQSRRDQASAAAELAAFERCRPADIQASMARIDALCEDFESESETDDECDEFGAPIDDTYTEIEELRLKAKAQEAKCRKAARALAEFDSDAGTNRRSARPATTTSRSQQKMKLQVKLEDAEEDFAQAARNFARLLKPVLNDTLGPFQVEDLELYHRSQANLDAFFYETRSPQDLFADQVQLDGPLEWSGVLRLGTALADEYLQFIDEDVKQLEDEELQRRKEVKFPDYAGLARD